MRKRLVLSMLAAASASCSSPRLDPGLQRGSAAYDAFAPSNSAVTAYRIGAFDAVDVIVFDEPELSAKSLEVDAAGNIMLPLVGPIGAAGRTSEQLSREIAVRLERFLVSPQVSVAVAASASQKVSVQGEVRHRGGEPRSAV